MISVLGTFPAVAKTIGRRALFAVCLSAAATANADVEIIGETHATFAWDSPTGAVAGYHVYVSLNGAAAELHSSVFDTNSQTIHAEFGEVIRLATAAFDANGNTGPRSDLSEAVYFVEAPTPTPTPATTPFLTPQPTATPIPTATPTQAPTATPTAKPTAVPSPTPTATTAPTDEPRASESPRPDEDSTSACDFDGDGYPDILFQNANTGALEFWKMEGTEVVDVIELLSMDRKWKIAATGNFDSDETTDILWYHERTNTARVWLMGDVAGADEFDLEIGPGWVIAGVGDFDGKGRTEIALWNQSARLEIWGLEDELVRLARFSIRRHSEVAGFGDIDGDGDDDVIIRDRRKREIGASLMSPNFSPQQVMLGTLAAQRDVIDSGDYDGDGQSDLLWRDLSWSALANAGVSHLSKDLQLSERPLEPNLDGNHSVVGSADYNGDGIADLLVFDQETRELVLWLLDAGGAYRFESLGTIAADWIPTGFTTHDTAIR